MTEPISDNMRIAQLQGHLKHCENEVNEAKNALDTAELHQRNAILSLIAATLEEAEARREQLLTDGEAQTLLAVATLYVEAFKDDDMMSLPEKLRLQRVEEILDKHGRRY